MRTSPKGIHLMHQFEGYRNKPYRCTADIWTVGWGHAMYDGQLRLPNLRKNGYEGPLRRDYELKPEDNRVWTKDELVALFDKDIVAFERGVLRRAPMLAERQELFDACVALSYNIGLGGFQRSTLRQRILRGEGDERLAEAFLMYTKSGGKVTPGLVRRRKAEIALFME
jgi:lysozyme